MQVGYIYIISHESFPENTYKLGYSYDDKKKLMSRYNTYYPSNITLHNTYLVCDKQLGEKLLFHKLRKYRLRTNREFFCCELDILRKACEEVVIIINDDCIMDKKEDDVIDENIYLVEKYKTNISKKTQNELNKKIKKENEKNEMHTRLTNIVSDFINTQCIIHEKSFVKSSVLYSHFKATNKNGYVDVKYFSPIVEELGYVKIKTVGGYIFNGIGIKPENVQIYNDTEIKKFIETTCEEVPHNFIYHSDLFDKYKNMYNNNISAKGFTLLMRQYGYDPKKRKDGNGFTGLKLRE